MFVCLLASLSINLNLLSRLSSSLIPACLSVCYRTISRLANLLRSPRNLYTRNLLGSSPTASELAPNALQDCSRPPSLQAGAAIRQTFERPKKPKPETSRRLHSLWTFRVPLHVCTDFSLRADSSPAFCQGASLR